MQGSRNRVRGYTRGLACPFLSAALEIPGSSDASAPGAEQITKVRKLCVEKKRCSTGVQSCQEFIPEYRAGGSKPRLPRCPRDLHRRWPERQTAPSGRGWACGSGGCGRVISTHQCSLVL